MNFQDKDLPNVLELMEEESMQFELVQSFRGRQRWLLIVMTLATLLLFGVTVWSGIQYFQTDAAEIKRLLAYMALFLWSSHGVSLLKTVYYGRLDRNAVRRDIRRLEIQLQALRNEKSE